MQRFSKRVIAFRLAGKLLKTKDTARLALDGLGTPPIGINWDKLGWDKDFALRTRLRRRALVLRGPAHGVLGSPLFAPTGGP